MAMDGGGGGIRLRPLGIGDVLDETFRVYRRHFIPIITVMAVVVVPSSLLSLAMVLLTGVSNTTVFDEIPTGASIAAVIAIVLLAILSSLAQLVAAGAAVRVSSDAILGQPISLGNAYLEALGRFVRLLAVSIVVFVPVAVLLVTCIGIPVAIYVALGWSLAFQAIMLEDRGVFGAMLRSWELVREHRWRLLACLLFVGLIVALLVSIPTGLYSFLAGIWVAMSGADPVAVLAMQVGNVVFQALGQTLFGALGYVTATLLYYDLRVRKEAFDLQQRLPQAGAPSTSSYPPPYSQPPHSPQSPPTAPQVPPPPQAPPYQ